MQWVEEDNTGDCEYAGKLDRGLSWVARATDEVAGDGATEFVASTASVDRMGDVVDQQTWRLAAFRTNPVILHEHHYPVVGVATRVGRTSTDDGRQELRIRVRWDDSEVNPTGMLVAHQHRNGFRRAVSVGFMPGEAKSRTELDASDPLFVNPKDTPRWMAGYVFRHNELLEVSSVSVPANREALQLSLFARLASDNDDAIRRFLSESTTKHVREGVLAAVRSDPEVRRAVLGLIYAERGTPSTSQAPAWFGS